MTTMLIDNSRDRGTMLVHLGITFVIALAAILAYLYSATVGVNYSRERDNVGTTYCMYWMPFSNFENSVADEPNAFGCPRFAQPAKTTGSQAS